MPNDARSWLKVTIDLPDSAVECVSDLLLSVDIDAIEIIDHECTLYPQRPGPGRSKVLAYFPPTSESRVIGAISSMATRSVKESDGFTYSIEPFTDFQWKENWKKFYHPVHIGGRISIYPVWEDPPKEPGRIHIKINPGLAFGTGTHGTTQLVLQLMLDHISHVDNHPQSMLDLGTGTGILAIAGALLGIPLVIACDNDEDAIENCRENLELNGMSDRISLHAKPLSDMTGQFHLVTANLLTHLLCENVGKLRSLTSPGGVLLLSGILMEDRGRIMDAFDGKGFRIITEQRCDEWLGISLMRVQPISP